ncbi:MAG TPA: DsbA family protein [Gemmatimonadaceae bacterium]|nr:DsbA family protein [Gemmatimonadaceae bacterium]
MILTQFNRLRLAATVALVLSCKPGASTPGSDAGSVTRSDTAAARSVAAAPDSNITRADLARIQGNANAPLWVIEVSDFQCPFCKQWHDQTYRTFRDEYVKTGKIRLAYVNFPLNSHRYAWPSAESAMCAGAQGKFWEMHDALFETQHQWEAIPSPQILFDSLARAAGVDIPKWRDCVNSGKMKPLIQADHDRASKAGAEATPSFMIGDQILAGAQPIDVLRRAIDSALVKSKKTTP